MKKKALLLASMGVLACTVGVTALAVGGGPKLNTIFETKAASKSFTFDAATGSQFENVPCFQTIDVMTGVSDPIHTEVSPEFIESLTFGEGERFVEAHPDSEQCGYFLQIGINNLTHFEIDMGVESDAGSSEDVYMVVLRDQYRSAVREWGNSPFELDGNGNGTAHLEWDKGDYDGTVVEVCVSLVFLDDSDEANLYVSSLSLSWNC